jgi:hypothetical protein
MDAGRVLHADLDLLDHQLRDRDGRLCGKVDDLELVRSGDTFYVAAILSGPGTLWCRLGAAKLGRWLERARRQVATAEPPGGEAQPTSDPGRISMGLVHRIGPVIDVAVTAGDLASSQAERWARENIISHIPGSRHATE